MGKAHDQQKTNPVKSDKYSHLNSQGKTAMQTQDKFKTAQSTAREEQASFVA